MTADDLLLLSHAIPDELRAIGLDDLADGAARVARWVDLVRPYVRSASIAGEDIHMGDILSRGPDELLYRTRSPVPIDGVVGASHGNTRKGGLVSYMSPRDYRGMLNWDGGRIDEDIERAFQVVMERVIS